MKDTLFEEGIRNAVQVCMNVNPDDRVLIISDVNTLEIGQALADQSNNLGAESKVIQLEDFGQRPLTDLPPGLIASLVEFQPTVTFYAAESQEGEVKMRMALTRAIRDEFTHHGFALPRHGHMVSIEPRLIREGMTADYNEINRLTLQVFEIVKDAESIQVTSEKGTEITAQFNHIYKWVPCHGLYHNPGDWGNLPEGEVFTCPQTMDGIVVADVLGDYFSPKYGVLDSPLKIEVADGLVRNVSSQNQQIADELMAYLYSSENGLRTGEFAIGTNTAVKELSGNLLQDEKIPGIHVAFGNPLGYHTGAEWRSEVHVDVVPVNCTITVDGRTIMKDGIFTI